MQNTTRNTGAIIAIRMATFASITWCLVMSAVQYLAGACNYKKCLSSSILPLVIRLFVAWLLLTAPSSYRLVWSFTPLSPPFLLISDVVILTYTSLTSSFLPDSICLLVLVLLVRSATYIKLFWSCPSDLLTDDICSAFVTENSDTKLMGLSKLINTWHITSTNARNFLFMWNLETIINIGLLFFY